MDLKEPTSGSVLYNGTDITHLPAWHRAQLDIGYVPEDRRVFGNLSVEENLRLGGYQLKDEAKKQRNIDQVYEMFPRLKESSGQLARTISGGEQQMLAIGRALVLTPKLLLIDKVSLWD